MKRVTILGKILVIAEKPSVGRDIARVLKCTVRGAGCLIGENYIVSWAVGHLVTLWEPEDYGEQFKKWSAETLPIIPEPMKLKSIDATRDQLQTLESLLAADEVDSLICATDSGREGELIFRYIYELTGCQKPFARLWISSMTDAAIEEGFRTLKPSTAYDNLYLSARCRSEADWLVGMNATRAYTIKYNALLSIGRVQTPTLAIIVAKQQEIDAFDATEYFEVQADYGNFSGIWFEQDAEGNAVSKITESTSAEEIVAKVQGQAAVVSQIEQEEKRQPAPLLYDLTELQRECNRKFGYSAQQTLSIAQALYETRKLITYPRTDSRYLSDDMPAKVQHTLQRLTSIPLYREFAGRILAQPLTFSKRIIDNDKVTDHHAIIPTDGAMRTEGLTQEEARVYNLIVLRFMAVFYAPYITSITKITVQCCEESFLSKGTTILQQGWMELYNALDNDRDNGKNSEQDDKAKSKKKTKKEDKKEEQVLPPLQQNDALTIKEATAQKKKTQPPKPYTEATLLSAMENAGRFIEDEELKEQLKDSGLGTPATRAATIERLLTVGYITRKGKALLPTEKGQKLIAVVPDQLKSPQTTGKWEKGLSSIAKGTMEHEKFMGSIKRFVNFLVDNSKKSVQTVIFAQEGKIYKPKTPELGICPQCGGSIHENSKSYFCSNWKQGCKFTIWKNSMEAFKLELTPSLITNLLKETAVPHIAVCKPGTDELYSATLCLRPNTNGALELQEITPQPQS